MMQWSTSIYQLEGPKPIILQQRINESEKPIKSDPNSIYLDWLLLLHNVHWCTSDADSLSKQCRVAIQRLWQSSMQCSCLFVCLLVGQPCQSQPTNKQTITRNASNAIMLNAHSKPRAPHGNAYCMSAACRRRSGSDRMRGLLSNAATNAQSHPISSE